MFLHLFSLIIALMIINSSFLIFPPYPKEELFFFIAGFFLWISTYTCLAFLKQILKRYPSTLSWISYFILLSTLFVYHLILYAHALLPNSSFLINLMSLFYYFIALWISPHRKYLYFLISFPVPFLFFQLALDLQEVLISPQSEFLSLIYAILCTLLLFILSPYLLNKCWRNPPLPKNELREQLEFVCQSARFKYSDLHIWRPLGNIYTAAILGIVPRFRYVLFTRNLLTFPANELQAILAHEIAHSQRKHLLFYPLLIFGFVLLSSLMHHMLQLVFPFSSSLIWIVPIYFLLPQILFLLIYLRIIFGFYSRKFERQADLHGLLLQIPLEDMQSALQRIALCNNIPLEKPDWHHYSLKERIQFLEQAKFNPKIAEDHHKNTRFWVVVYLGMLFLLIIYIYFE